MRPAEPPGRDEALSVDTLKYSPRVKKSDASHKLEPICILISPTAMTRCCQYGAKHFVMMKMKGYAKKYKLPAARYCLRNVCNFIPPSLAEDWTAHKNQTYSNSLMTSSTQPTTPSFS
mmetsp:Transcript_88962/g.226417  ORF Transcript_88962/g.226417 Transcript_88962/m.226417 type:complete len:118 (+) Transcript_88962:98-451(+)